MKRFKHCGMLLASLLALTALLTGAAMAAESPNGARPVISVQLNGEMVPFTDVVPEVVDQRDLPALPGGAGGHGGRGGL